MKYINMDDLTTIIQNRLLIESIEKEEEILAGIEDLVVSVASGQRHSCRYDVGKIFGDPPIRTGLLVRVVACITACRAVSRNATRKVPDSLSGLNDWADGILVKLRDGIMTLPQDIPPVTDEDGNAQYPILYGNTRNGGWFL